MLSRKLVRSQNGWAQRLLAAVREGVLCLANRQRNLRIAVAKRSLLQRKRFARPIQLLWTRLPVDMHAEEGVSAAQVVAGVLLLPCESLTPTQWKHLKLGTYYATFGGVYNSIIPRL